MQGPFICAGGSMTGSYWQTDDVFVLCEDQCPYTMLVSGLEYSANRPINSASTGGWRVPHVRRPRSEAPPPHHRASGGAMSTPAFSPPYSLVFETTYSRPINLLDVLRKPFLPAHTTSQAFQPPPALQNGARYNADAHHAGSGEIWNQ